MLLCVRTYAKTLCQLLLASTLYEQQSIRKQFHYLFFFFNDTATTEIYTLSLHDALPIYLGSDALVSPARPRHRYGWWIDTDRKSTRLNSSHTVISYAVFCLKKKKKR